MLINAAAAAAAENGPRNPWSALKGPVSGINGDAEVLGEYSNGCIRNAKAAVKSTAYWEVVNTKRNRYYGHPALLSFLKEIGRWSMGKGFGKIVLGDLSQPAGGPMDSMHRSHQSGLDVDIRFRFWGPGKEMTNREGFQEVDVAVYEIENDKPPYLFIPRINENWNSGFGELLERVASHPQVERILISPPIKEQVCKQFPASPEWLRKLRPIHGHKAHFHVRLACPKAFRGVEDGKEISWIESKQCKSQGDIRLPKGETPDLTADERAERVGCKGKDLSQWLDPGGTIGQAMVEGKRRNFEEKKKKSSVDPVNHQKSKPADAAASKPHQPKWQKLPQACKDLMNQATAPAAVIEEGAPATQ